VLEVGIPEAHDAGIRVVNPATTQARPPAQAVRRPGLAGMGDQADAAAWHGEKA
jgi:hypothetical protein